MQMRKVGFYTMGRLQMLSIDFVRSQSIRIRNKSVYVSLALIVFFFNSSIITTSNAQQASNSRQLPYIFNVGNNLGVICSPDGVIISRPVPDLYIEYENDDYIVFSGAEVNEDPKLDVEYITHAAIYIKANHFFSDFVYSVIDRFADGLCSVRSFDGKWGYIDTNGVLVIPTVWFYAEPFCHGLGLVAIETQDGFGTGGYGYQYVCINRNGVIVSLDTELYWNLWEKYLWGTEE